MCFDGIELEINSRSMGHLPQAPGLPAWSQKSPWPLSPPKAALTRHWRNTWWSNLRTVIGTCWKKPRLLSCWGSTFNRKLLPSPHKMGIMKIPGLSPVLWYHTEGSILKAAGSNSNSDHLSTKTIEDHESNSPSLPIEAMAISYLTRDLYSMHVDGF